MKTAISVPDDVFAAAERAAKNLGVSRSQLYASAVRAYLEKVDREDVTARLNAVYGDHGEESGLDPIVASMQYRTLSHETWD